MRDFHFQRQENIKPAKWDAQFQAYGIDGRGVLEALKKLMVYTVLWGNGPETLLEMSGPTQSKSEGKI